MKVSIHGFWFILGFLYGCYTMSQITEYPELTLFNVDWAATQVVIGLGLILGFALYGLSKALANAWNRLAKKTVTIEPTKL